MMQLLDKASYTKEVSVSSLLEQDGCDEYSLISDGLLINGYRYEVWWYNYREEKYLLMKQCETPCVLYFFRYQTSGCFEMDTFQELLEL